MLDDDGWPSLHLIWHTIEKVWTPLFFHYSSIQLIYCNFQHTNNPSRMMFEIYGYKAYG